jgi:hypothetical protein
MAVGKGQKGTSRVGGASQRRVNQTARPAGTKQTRTQRTASPQPHGGKLTGRSKSLPQP